MNTKISSIRQIKLTISGTQTKLLGIQRSRKIWPVMKRGKKSINKKGTRNDPDDNKQRH